MRTLRRSPLILAALLCAAAAAWPAAAAPPGAHRETSRTGTWRATFSYVKKNAGGLPSYTNLRLTVSNGTRQVYDAPVVSRLASTGQLEPGGFDGTSSVSFRDLDGDGTPELLLNLYTGGAHCCFLTQVLDLVSSPPLKREIDFADAGSRLIVVAGRVLFRTNDPVFAYAFTDFADSGAHLSCGLTHAQASGT